MPMDRSTFLQSLFVLPAAYVAGKFLSDDLAEVRKKYPHVNFDKPVPPLSIDLNYINFGSRGPTPADILKMYSETGVLIWKSKPGDPPEFKPFIEIKGS